VLSAAVAITGCTLLGPRPNGAQQPSEPAPTSTSTTPPRPPRPHEVPLEGVDPCSLLTAPQRKQFSFDRSPTRGTDTTMAQAKVCDFRDSVSALSARIALVTAEGIEVWEDPIAQNQTRRTLVAGFPALVVRSDNREGFCNVEVDVANGQFLDVMYGNAGSPTPPAFDNLCLSAQQVAAAVMTTLANRG
jgi:hypothetical protein